MIYPYFKQVKKAIDGIDRKAINALIDELYKLKENKGRLFILGVGGSAANASHAVNDFRKLCGIEAYAPTDNVAELTARTNDDGWDSVFVNWLKVSRLSKIDAILVLSVGGGSMTQNVSNNLVRGLKYAKEVGSRVYGIVGRDGGYTKKVADVCILIPTINPLLITPICESLQAIIWHAIAFHPTLNEQAGKWESIETNNPNNKRRN